MFVDPFFSECGEVFAEERRNLVEKIDQRVEDLITARFRCPRREHVVGALVQVETWINKRTLKQGQVSQQGVTYESTDQPTNRPTDTASYRGALSHLKMDNMTVAILANFKNMWFAVTKLQSWSGSKGLLLRLRGT